MIIANNAKLNNKIQKKTIKLKSQKRVILKLKTNNKKIKLINVLIVQDLENINAIKINVLRIIYQELFFLIKIFFYKGNYYIFYDYRNLVTDFNGAIFSLTDSDNSTSI